jgi:hypothetical protein
MKLSDKSLVIKNLIAFTISFILLNIPAAGITSIQSVLNPASGLGIASQLVMFCTQILTCIIVPQLFKELFGYSKSIIIACLLVSCYIALNMYPRWYTLMPGI